MRKNPVDPGQRDQPEPASGQRLNTRNGLRARLTPVRVAMGTLAFSLLIISAAISLSGTRTSYASVRSPFVFTACDLTANPAGCTPTDTPTPPTPTDTPTPTPTATNTPAPTATATKAPTPKPIATRPVTTIPPVSVSPTVSASATAVTSPTATSAAQTPVSGNTPTTASTPTGNTNGSVPQQQQTGGGGGGSTRVVMIIVAIVLVLLAGLGVGWFFFRRMLLPQGTPNPNLPPSGARPWARTRAPNPDSLGGLAAVQGAPALMNAGAGGPTQNGFAQGGPAGGNGFGAGGPNQNGFPQGGPAGGNGFGAGGPNQNGFPQGANNGYSGPGGFAPQSMNGPQSMGVNSGPGFGPQGMNGNGFGGFSDGFIPPSPQIFPQGDGSMIPPGSGAFPVVAGANGFAPASPAFNAMYGLPDDPFAGSQNGSPGWMGNLGNTNGNGNGANGNGFGTPPQQNGGNFVPGQVDLNDPQLAEVIRQYSQKSQSLPPDVQQMSPGQPTQQMSPAQSRTQQMSPGQPMQNVIPPRPQQMSPGQSMQNVIPARPQQMSPTRPGQQMLPNQAGVQQMSPAPVPQIPQREPRPGAQDSNWLQ